MHWLRGIPPGRLLRTITPVALAPVLAVLIFDDPTYRYALIAASLPFQLRAAATLLDLPLTPEMGSRTTWLLQAAGFTSMVLGWTVMFTILAMVLVVGVIGVPFSFVAMKQSALVGSLGFIAAAWFWWPFYARNVLSSWPGHDRRIFVRASNNWDALAHASRIQQSRTGTRIPGFITVTLIAAATIGASAAGALDHPLSAIAAIVAAACLPLLHVVVVAEANRLCQGWGASLRQDEVERA